jgi:hypothetical protein
MASWERTPKSSLSCYHCGRKLTLNESTWVSSDPPFGLCRKHFSSYEQAFKAAAHTVTGKTVA